MPYWEPIEAFAATHTGFLCMRTSGQTAVAVSIGVHVATAIATGCWTFENYLVHRQNCIWHIGVRGIRTKGMNLKF